ncbi:hypothetical protein K437DRAFT_270342 [Tilletiaria anomala UBC 951]|uniref:Uncharacterized protein n=1 Tax=Tilletiaria anomala (strain ATCC 24038 / CBS 436.72 / UBC 951) TaxID=1037660 RepID=A0A066VKY3_TILAU|nr:uncharacterized protein K437DRAFT_270342 [Tilletiaria anomala UBC 951]KDN39240.1 hypothetical protein K437DRAFT_270342 [Tilletiaria anomala UBC 951]
MEYNSKYNEAVQDERILQAAALPLANMPSCMNLFDKWATCFALGPQARALYRYGTFQDCKDKLDDFKFCLTLKGMSNEERRQVWIERRAEQSAAKRLQSSSEDVWDLRRSPLVDPAYAEAA